MDQATMKAAVRRYYDEIWSGGNLALIDELMAADYVNRDPATPVEDGALHGREAFKGLVTTYRTTFPDLDMRVTEQFAEGDTVVSLWRASGTMSAPLNGLPATGRSGAVTGITVSRFVGGRIAEDRVVWDLFGLLRQLGLVPDPATA